jgi:hypothetical protein
LFYAVLTIFLNKSNLNGIHMNRPKPMSKKMNPIGPARKKGGKLG